MPSAAGPPARHTMGHNPEYYSTHSYAEGTAATSVAPAATLDSHMMNATHQTGHHHYSPQNTMKMVGAAAASAEPVANRRQMCPPSTAEFVTGHLRPPQEEEEAAA